MSWPMVALGEITEVVMGQAPPGKACNRDGVGTPFIKAGEFADPFPVVREWTTKPLKVAHSGDVLVCVVGATCGKVSRGIDAAIGRSAAAVRPLEPLSSEYLLRFLHGKTGDLRQKAQGLAQGVITRNMLNELKIPLPPLDEQRRVAGILDAADALRRRRCETLALLDTLPGAIFAQMFGDPVERASGKRFVPLGDIASKIGSGATPRGGAKVYRDEGTKFIRSMNVRDGTFSEDGLVRIDDTAARQLASVEVTENDVFLNITGASVARCCRSDPSLNGARVNQHVAIIRPTDAKLTDFLMGALCHPRMNANLLRIAEAGATRQAITKAEIERIEVPEPTAIDAENYSRRLSTAKLLHENASNHLFQLGALFASLQSRAFAGEL